MTSITRTLTATLLGALTLAFAPAGMAQTNPTIRAFTVQQVPELSPGTELVFKLTGTPGGSASVRLDGSANTVSLTEGASGVYQGAYTLNIRDQVHHDSQVRATLQVGSRSAQSVLGQTLLTASAQKAADKASQAALAAPEVDQFTSEPSGPLSGGYDIGFTLRGTPGGQASLTIKGSDAKVPLTEVRPGEYQARYTIRSRDRLSESSLAKATLTVGGKSTVVEKTLVGPSVQSQPQSQTGTWSTHHRCDACGTVESINLVEVQADPGYVGAIAGGVAGAVLGNQVGKGDGRTAARILGAVGGAYAGREIEKRVKKEQRYEVRVRMANGGTQTVQLEQEPKLRVGAQVQVVNGQLQPND